MKDLLFSPFETYLLEEDQHIQRQSHDQLEKYQKEERTEYPPGFFTGL